MRKYCNDCGSPLKVSKRRPDYDVMTGELRGWYLDLVCNGNWWQRLKSTGVYWEYEKAHTQNNPKVIKDNRRIDK